MDSTSSKMLNTQIHPFAPRLATFSANFSNTQVVLYHTSELIETGTLVSFPDPVLKFGYEMDLQLGRECKWEERGGAELFFAMTDKFQRAV